MLFWPPRLKGFFTFGKQLVTIITSCGGSEHGRMRAVGDVELAGKIAEWARGLEELSNSLLTKVNELLRSLGAPELGSLVLSIECRYEDGEQGAERVPGLYDPSSRKIRLYLCGDSYDLKTLIHELVHHLQFSDHAGVAYRRESVESFTEMLPYSHRPHELEARWRAEAAVELLEQVPQRVTEAAPFNGQVERLRELKDLLVKASAYAGLLWELVEKHTEASVELNKAVEALFDNGSETMEVWTRLSGDGIEVFTEYAHLYLKSSGGLPLDIQRALRLVGVVRARLKGSANSRSPLLIFNREDLLRALRSEGLKQEGVTDTREELPFEEAVKRLLRIVEDPCSLFEYIKSAEEQNRVWLQLRLEVNTLEYYGYDFALRICTRGSAEQLLKLLEERCKMQRLREQLIRELELKERKELELEFEPMGK
ncbi:hypothetical protein MA03_02750 [Infirmifilum uzonense]|uniref:Uncharacterized protein n=2 Tax=Infirmifilum uzonense TaxID=1550241 RepID=A0A0F7FH15_9CREN|nr:hypothetical protein MA03_02750 [Infirmifilum uzonense]